MFETFLQFFPACCLFVTLAFIVIDEWQKEDRTVRRSLAGRLLRVGNRVRVVEEDGTPLVDYDIATYFDDLPEQRRV